MPTTHPTAAEYAHADSLHEKYRAASAADIDGDEARAAYREYADYVTAHRIGDGGGMPDV